MALSPAERHRAARAAARQLLRCRALSRVRRIAIYLSHGSELDTAPLLRALYSRGSHVYVPVILRNQRLSFVRLRPATRLRRDHLGIRQPAKLRPHCTVKRLQAIMLPLLGFDPQGHRLGQGGGYYDRTLAHCRHRPLRIGYAYSAQEVAAVPSEPWDQALDAVVTEKGMRRFRPG